MPSGGRLATLMQDARAGSLDWRDSPRASLAQIVVLDQFFRNAWRDTPRPSLAIARVACRCPCFLRRRCHARTAGAGLRLSAFRACRIPSRSRTGRLHCSMSLLRHGPQFKPYLDFAIRHREVIRRFGRFPHRNRILGRPPVPGITLPPSRFRVLERQHRCKVCRRTSRQRDSGDREFFASQRSRCIDCAASRTKP